MRSVTLILTAVVALGGGAMTVGCQDDSRRVDDQRIEGRARTASERRGAEIEFGNGRDMRLDRGVPENSSTNPRAENGIGGPTATPRDIGGANPGPAVP